MSLIRRLFGSGITDEEKDEYRARSEIRERSIADKRTALYQAVNQVDERSRLFEVYAGKSRLMRDQGD